MPRSQEAAYARIATRVLMHPDGPFETFPAKLGPKPKNLWLMFLIGDLVALIDVARGRHLASFSAAWPGAAQRRFAGLCKRKRERLAAEGAGAGAVDDDAMDLHIAVVTTDSADGGLGFKAHAPGDAWYDVIGARHPMLRWLGRNYGLGGDLDEGVRAWVYRAPC